jgi:hypothetical protein
MITRTARRSELQGSIVRRTLVAKRNASECLKTLVFRRITLMGAPLYYEITCTLHTSRVTYCKEYD